MMASIVPLDLLSTLGKVVAANQSLLVAFDLFRVRSSQLGVSVKEVDVPMPPCVGAQNLRCRAL